MTHPDLPAAARAVEKAVNANACTSRTVEDLRCLLGLTIDSMTSKGPKSAKENLVGKKNAGLKSQPRSRALGNSTKAALGDREDQLLALETSVSAKFATQIVNSSLKTLTAIVRLESSTGGVEQQRNAQTLVAATPRPMKSSRPLQTRSPNRQTSPKSFPGLEVTRTGISSAGNAVHSVATLAECTSAAFTVLRRQGDLTNGAGGAKRYQVELGMSSFVGKLLALGLDVLASKELRVLISRLEPESDHGAVCKPQKVARPQKTSTVQSERSLADLLLCNALPDDEQALEILITSQIQVLKLISRSFKPRLIEQVLSVMEAKGNTGLSAIQKRLQAGSAELITKASKWLEQIAHLLENLASLKPTADASIRYCDTSFRSRALASRIRLRSWVLNDAGRGLQKHILDPFHAHISSYVQHREIPCCERYSKITQVVKRFLEELEIVTTRSKIPDLYGFAASKSYRALADVARESQNFSTAAEWLEKALGVPSASKCDSCILTCQWATVHIQQALFGAAGIPLETSLRSAVEYLKQDVQGNSMELDELFLSVASLRKYATSLLVKTSVNTSEKSMEMSLASQKLCQAILLRCAKFLVRFAGGIDPHHQDTRSEPRAQRRLELVRKSISPTTEALAALIRTSLIDHADSWKEVALCLHDCQSLALTFDDQDSGEQSQAPHNRRHPFATISNAFWFRYLDVKTKSPGSRELIQLLQASIDPLSARPAEERESAFLHLKFEKLAGILEAQRDWEGASRAYLEALSTLVAYPSSLDNFQQRPHSILTTASQNSNFGRLRQLINAYMRTQEKLLAISGKQFSPFQPTELAPMTRGVLLELQLGIATDSLQTDLPFRSGDVFSQLHALLRDVYGAENSSQRRFSVHFKLLQGSCINPNAYPHGFYDVLDAEFRKLSENLANDDETDHLRNQHEAYMIILEKKSQVRNLSSILESWHRLVCATPQVAKPKGPCLDSPEWLAQLKLLKEFAVFSGNERHLALVMDILVQLGRSSASRSESIQHSAMLSQQFTRLGHCDLARVSLLQTQKTVAEENEAQTSSLQWYLAYSEYLLEIENVAKCNEMLVLAQKQVHGLWGASSGGGMSASERFQQLSHVSQLAHLRSRWAQANGHQGEALYHAKKSTRLIYRAWSLLERQQNTRSSQDAHFASAVTVSLGTLISESQPVVSTEHDSLRETPFWSLGPLLFRHTSNLAYLLSYEGMVLEAQYYADRAEKIVKAIGSDRFQAEFLVLKTFIDRSAGDKLSSLPSLKSFATSVESLPLPVQADVKLALAEACSKTGDLEEEVQLLKDVEGIMKKSFLPPITLTATATSTIDVLSAGIETLSLNANSSQNGSSRKAASTSRKGVKQREAAELAEKTRRPTENPIKAENLPLLKRQARRLRQSALLSLRLKDLDLAASMLQEADGIMRSTQDAGIHQLCHSTLAMRKAISQLARDPVFGLLQESTIMYPSVVPGSKIGKDESDSEMVPRAPKGRSGKTAAAVKMSSADAHDEHAHAISSLLGNSSQTLLRAFGNSQTHATTAIGHSFSDTLYKSQLLLSVTGSSASKVTLTPAFAAYAFEHGRSLAFLRDDASIIADRLVDAEKDHSQEVLMELSPPEISLPRIDIASFQSEYIDTIPSNWTAISIAISADHDELRISRMRPQHAPLTLSIPLNRHNPRDEEEESFGFDEGKAEMLEIISLANFSAHEGCDLSKKGAKTAWWETRAALDARLKDLVVNIQNMWIGGFRGVFSQHVAPPALLSRFQKSLDNILNAHLPSRRRTSKGSKNPRVVLDVQVLELFLGLGTPVEHEDLDEALLDLFYFVVDILQFHGERNAYDEIDFDPMIIETRDALTHYHNAVAEMHEQHLPQHTILILDRALHAFPWESLPCFDGLALSRLPSLSCLRDRILQQRAQSPDAPYLTVDGSSGSYILNPSGDLVSTHKTFLHPLSALTSWDATVKTAPTEDAITAALASKALYLYFGHGSGGQYVRSRAIRKLEQCAVAMLWGCSSGALIEAGDFESYGPPMAYLHGKCPAVVGTLWDVTDKDVDRFAMRALERWGLFEKQRDDEKGAEVSNSKGSGSGRRGKGAGKKKGENGVGDVEKGKVSLDKAIAEARESCILRYLNGAAPVVYGVPVMLK